MSGVITDARAQISRIAEAGEAASEANAQRFKRFGALLEADYGKDKLQFFLSKPPEERRKDLDNLDKHVEDLKAVSCELSCDNAITCSDTPLPLLATQQHLQRVNLETERAKESALAIARSIERLFGEKKDLEEVALVESSEADTLQMTLKDIEPILEKLKILATDLGTFPLFHILSLSLSSTFLTCFSLCRGGLDVYGSSRLRNVCRSPTGRWN